jgi:Domain of unknown function (DUF4123)
VHVEGGPKWFAIFGVAVAAMDFACDAVDRATVDAFAKEALRRDEQAPWLLIDAALLDDNQLESQLRMRGWNGHSALAASPLAAFDKRAPQLIQLTEPADAIARGIWALTSLGRDAPAFSMLHSSAPLEELQRVFAYLAYAILEDDMPVHCRFADTRVLPSLLSVLSLTQAARVSHVVASWRWWDRQNSARCWPEKLTGEQGGRGAAQDDAQHVKLGSEEFASMLDAAEADSIFMQLVDTTPELVPDTRRGQFHQRLRTQLAQAAGRGVTQASDRLQFVVLSLSCGDGFHEHRVLESTWASVAQHGARLSEVMAGWDDALWDALSPKKEAAA